MQAEGRAKAQIKCMARLPFHRKAVQQHTAIHTQAQLQYWTSVHSSAHPVPSPGTLPAGHQKQPLLNFQVIAGSGLQTLQAQASEHTVGSATQR
jgi:hypothetical protein